MKQPLARRTCLALFGYALVACQPAWSGSVGGFGGATEVTQLANNVELVQQYALQVQAYATQLQQYQNMLTNTLQLPQQVWGSVESDLVALSQVVKQGQAIAYSSSQIGMEFENRFKGFRYPAGFDYKTDYRNWSLTTMDNLRGALESAGLQSRQFVDEEAVLKRLRAMSQSAQGQMQAVQVGSQIAEQQVQQLQKLRQLMMLQLQSQNVYLAAQENKEATIKAAKDQAFGYQDPRGPYQTFKGGTR